MTKARPDSRDRISGWGDKLTEWLQGFLPTPEPVPVPARPSTPPPRRR